MKSLLFENDIIESVPKVLGSRGLIVENEDYRLSICSI